MAVGKKISQNLILRVVVTAFLLIYLASKLNWQELGYQLLRAELQWLLVACFFIGLTFVFGSIRWWLLLKVQGVVLPLRIVSMLTLIGQFFNSFLLGSTGGDIVKILYLLKHCPEQRARATLSVILDRAMGLFVLLSIVLLLLPWQAHVLLDREETKLIAKALIGIFVVMVISAAIIAIVPFKKFPNIFFRIWIKIPRHDIFETFIAGFRQHGQVLHLTLLALVISFLIFLMIFLAGYFLAEAIHLDATFGQVLICMSVVLCIISLPISVGGHGLREGAFVLMFSVFGVISGDGSGGNIEQAILYSILFFAIYSVWSLIGGMVYVTYKHVSPEQNEAVQR